MKSLLLILAVISSSLFAQESNLTKPLSKGEKIEVSEAVTLLNRNIPAPICASTDERFAATTKVRRLLLAIRTEMNRDLTVYGSTVSGSSICVIINIAP